METRFSRVWAMPNCDTFQVAPIHDFVCRHLRGVSVDPFARNTKYATYRNDLNPLTQAEYHLEALEFLQMLAARGVKADTVIFDPPYSPRQMKEVYEQVGKHFGVDDQHNTGRWTAERGAIVDLLADDGIVLSFGWNTQGIGKQYGFRPVEVLLVCHGGAHNDTICMAEKRVQGGLFASIGREIRKATEGKI